MHKKKTSDNQIVNLQTIKAGTLNVFSRERERELWNPFLPLPCPSSWFPTCLMLIYMVFEQIRSTQKIHSSPSSWRRPIHLKLSGKAPPIHRNNQKSIPGCCWVCEYLPEQKKKKPYLMSVSMAGINKLHGHNRLGSSRKGFRVIYVQNAGLS